MADHPTWARSGNGLRTLHEDPSAHDLGASAITRSATTAVGAGRPALVHPAARDHGGPAVLGRDGRPRLHRRRGPGTPGAHGRPTRRRPLRLARRGGRRILTVRPLTGAVGRGPTAPPTHGGRHAGQRVRGEHQLGRVDRERDDVHRRRRPLDGPVRPAVPGGRVLLGVDRDRRCHVQRPDPDGNEPGHVRRVDVLLRLVRDAPGLRGGHQCPRRPRRPHRLDHHRERPRCLDHHAR